ncbi:MAG: hypothetical protein NTU61_00210 [Candidatus Altiarchaeota archaeon]|nr:hypothetical protein [Candidatus Altiarchaeota archaeon]
MEKMRKNALTLVLLITLIGLSIAISEYEAIDHYNSALTFISSNEYKNALRSIYRSREVYEELNITSGISRCEQVISQINATLTQEQMADAYYDIAGEYFLLGGNTIDNMERVIFMSQNAKDRYYETRDSEGVLKADNLIQSANTTIIGIKESRLEEADQFFLQAQQKYLVGDYVTARTYALNASQLYASIPEPNGMSKTATLVSTIEDMIRGIKINGAASYDKALQLYAKEDYEQSINFAIESRRLYESVEDADGVQKTTLLISNINEKIGQNLDSTLRRARSLYLEAQELYIIQDCINSTRRASDSRAIYKDLYDKAWAEEKDKWPEERVKTKTYAAYIKEVDDLVAKIQKVCGENVMLQQAEKFYQDAQQNFLNNKLDDAMSYAKNARNIYSDLKNYVGLSKCDSLIEQINNKLTQLQQAENYMNNSMNYYRSADFEKANYEATQAKSIYDKMFYAEKSNTVQTFMERIANASKNTEFEIIEYGSSLDNAKLAKLLDGQINYTLGVNQSDILVRDSESKVSEEQAKLYNTIIVIVLAAVVVGAAAYSWMSKQRKFETEVTEKRAIADQKMKKKEEELTLRKEDEVKEKVEEELRRLIDREREMSSEGERKNV